MSIENVRFSFNKRKLRLPADLINTKIDKLNKQLIEMNFFPLRPKKIIFNFYREIILLLIGCMIILFFLIFIFFL